MTMIHSIEQAPREGMALVVISTNWCKYCASTHSAIDAVLPEHPDIAIARIDGDDNPDALAGLEGAKTYPQLLLMKDGVVVARRESADEDALRAWINENRPVPA